MVAENTDYSTDSDGVDESSEADTLKSNFKSIEMDIEQNDKVISESIETLKATSLSHYSKITSTNYL